MNGILLGQIVKILECCISYKRSTLAFCVVVILFFNLGFQFDLAFQVAAENLPFWERAYPCSNPTRRTYAQIVYDEARKEVVLFGGFDSNQNRADTLIWDGSSWSKRNSPISPSARIKHRMVYDRQRQVVLLFGGNSNGEFLNDTWEWNGTSWTKREVSVSPLRRDSFEMAYDSHRGVTVLFGGFFADTKAQDLGDTWEWNGTAWNQRAASNPDLSRNSPMMAYDEERRLTILFGGFNQTRLGDTWAWDGSSWSKFSYSNSPPPRNFGSLVFDSSLKRLILFGGLLSEKLYAADTWELTSTGWKEITLGASPSARCCGGVAYDRDRAELVLFGGDSGLGTLSHLGDTHIFSNKLTRPSCENGTTIVDRVVSLQQETPVPTPTPTPTPILTPSSSTTPVTFQPTLPLPASTPTGNSTDLNSLVPGDNPPTVTPPVFFSGTPTFFPTGSTSGTPTVSPSGTPTNITVPNSIYGQTPSAQASSLVPTTPTIAIGLPSAGAVSPATPIPPTVLSTSDSSTIVIQALPTIALVATPTQIPTPIPTPIPIPIPIPILTPGQAWAATPIPTVTGPLALPVTEGPVLATIPQTVGVPNSTQTVGVPNLAVGRVLVREEPLKGVFVFSERLGSTVTHEDGTFRLSLPKNGLLPNERVRLSRSGYLLSPEEVQLDQHLNQTLNVSATLMSDHFKDCKVRDETSRKVRIDTILREIDDHISTLKRMFLFISSGQKFKGADIATQTVRSLLSALSKSPEAYYSCERSTGCITVSTATVARDASRVVNLLKRQLKIVADELTRIARLPARERSRIKFFQKTKTQLISRELKSLPRTSSFCKEL